MTRHQPCLEILPAVQILHFSHFLACHWPWSSQVHGIDGFKQSICLCGIHTGFAAFLGWQVIFSGMWRVQCTPVCCHSLNWRLSAHSSTAGAPTLALVLLEMGAGRLDTLAPPGTVRRESPGWYAGFQVEDDTCFVLGFPLQQDPAPVSKSLH